MSHLFLIDLDNTLVFTDKANNLAYEKAIKSIFKDNYLSKYIFKQLLEIADGKRITQETLNKLFYSQYENKKFLSQRALQCDFIKLVISNKKKEYKNFLCETQYNRDEILTHLNNLVNDFSESFFYIVTKADIFRVQQLLDYHNISKDLNIKGILNYKATYKYQLALNDLRHEILTNNIPLNNIYIFDDEKEQIEHAKYLGIPHHNLILIHNTENNYEPKY